MVRTVFSSRDLPILILAGWLAGWITGWLSEFALLFPPITLFSLLISVFCCVLTKGQDNE
ncbi:hypothetical protein BO82DRAFT_357198 [Aspergillus uvarum CBS 121591]|uniref:Uncharacterized protein n=1 Tax=Aspergillus uvarum CBS 121591 TaxID=1448315 RepID=A0A319BXP5_9EURO|nr:hypothetical protein BO82DRAFT_357198 [Aspergillus uvarum CBS 121591]PYH78476.1 hypothetical protein BO82DRAFT_357198 [Aspergillus uvarum CBS 121591]